MSTPRLSKTNAYWTAITVEVPEEDGSISTLTGRIKFKRIVRKDLDALLGLGDEKICRTVILDWEEFRDVDGNPISYDDTGRDAVYADVRFVGALAKAFVLSLSEAPRKNS